MSEPTTQSTENDRPRYAEVRVPLSGSNVRTVVLVTCRDCGAFVFNRLAHDDHHRVIPPDTTDQSEATS